MESTDQQIYKVTRCFQEKKRNGGETLNGQVMDGNQTIATKEVRQRSFAELLRSSEGVETMMMFQIIICHDHIEARAGQHSEPWLREL